MHHYSCSKAVVNTRHTYAYFTYLWHVNITHAAFVHFVNICTILTNNTTKIWKIRIRGWGVHKLNTRVNKLSKGLG
jgi:hypothetical protein